MRILLVASIVSIVIGVSTATEEHRSLAWIEGFAIFIAVFVCCNVTAVNVYINVIEGLPKREVIPKFKLNGW